MITDKEFQKIVKQAEIAALILQYGEDYNNPIAAEKFARKRRLQAKYESTLKWDLWIKLND